MEELSQTQIEFGREPKLEEERRMGEEKGRKAKEKLQREKTYIPLRMRLIFCVVDWIENN
jgi:hypothetical protein